uniref:Uncharacterized protein n=1 Tax=Anguilla anguilla TaxID=7936 RepID=A0A0E9XAM0_ANGAN
MTAHFKSRSGNAPDYFETQAVIQYSRFFK